MIDIIGQLLLKDLQKINKFKSAVIAGGMVRDSHLGGDWKDIDVFSPVPVTLADVVNLEKINLVLKDGGLSPKKYGPTGTYKVYNFTYHDTIPVQIIYSTQYDTSIPYGEDVIRKFNYGIDQAYWDGEKEGSTEQFKSDIKHSYATLTKLDYLSDLPNAISKFNRLQAKYPQLEFSSTVLEIVKPRESKQKILTGKQFEDRLYKEYFEKADRPVPLAIDGEWIGGQVGNNPVIAPAVPAQAERVNLGPVPNWGEPGRIPVGGEPGVLMWEPGVILEENFNRNL